MQPPPDPPGPTCTPTHPRPANSPSPPPPAHLAQVCGYGRDPSQGPGYRHASPEGDLAPSLRARPAAVARLPPPSHPGCHSLHPPTSLSRPAPQPVGSPPQKPLQPPLSATSLSCLLPEYTGLGVELGGLLTSSQVTPRVPWTVWGPTEDGRRPRSPGLQARVWGWGQLESAMLHTLSAPERAPALS